MKTQKTRRDILLAVQQMIRERGHGAVTVRSLAEAAGCSYTNLYYYFKDLDALFWEARLGLIETMIEELATADPIADATRGFTAYVDYFLRYPAVFRFFYFYPFVRPAGDDATRQIEERLQGLWGSAFAPLVRDGKLSPTEAETAGKTLLYAMHGLLLLHFAADGQLDGDAVKQELAEIVQSCLKSA